MTAAGVDRITLEVVRNALPAIANEMSQDLRRSSYNMMIYEVGDYSCALLATDGSLIAQNMGGVSHFVADLGVVIRDGVLRYGPDGFAPGDVVLTNHQRVAGQHLNNVVVYTPIFHEDRLLGFAAIRAHWVDIGGMSTGFGAGGLAYDPWVEGLQLDQVKAWEAGVPDEKLLRVLGDNIRYPEASMGDLRSQVAACQLGARRYAELGARYGADTVADGLRVIVAQAERKCRLAVEAIPDGVYRAESFLDGDPADQGRPVEVRVTVTVSGGDMEIDLSGCSGQRRAAVNSRTLAGALVAYKALTAPEDPVNEGSFAAATVIIPEGNVMMARFPAPMASWSSIIPTVVETIFKALAPAIPDRVAAGHHGTLGIPVVFFGTDRRGRRFVSQSIEGGGWGGRPFEDGESASVSICQGDVRNSPIENIELKVPLVVEERALVPDSGGPGRYRGGLGIGIRLRSLVEGRWNLNQSRRRGLPSWGLWGGASGGAPDNLLRRPGEERASSVNGAHVQAPAGSIVIQRSAGGGGWGNPDQRDPALVLADVREGLVSVDGARRDYGVVLTADATAVDEPATRALRASRGQEER
jgi:N-methylhydantoinase B